MSTKGFTVGFKGKTRSKKEELASTILNNIMGPQGPFLSQGIWGV
jgi:hypothetical protein